MSFHLANERKHSDLAKMIHSPKKVKAPKEENMVSLGSQVVGGELIWGVVHIFPSFNDTLVHVTDSPDATMLAAQDISTLYEGVVITALHIKIRATGGAGSAFRALARAGIRIRRIEDTH
ncbi:hypothetical protein C8J56DRAFT_999563 [Mycena floridula]|nr:hypothetical protein C8J56DRAFT_999563 [Mycena floridula]